MQLKWHFKSLEQLQVQVITAALSPDYRAVCKKCTATCGVLNL